jgi:putative phosphoribosyl transferase
MGGLIEDTALRDRTLVFQDRREAGKLLSKKLVEYKGADAVILAVPSGGVPVASEVASGLDLPMDLVIVRKMQIPYNTEAGFGAVGPDGEVLINERLLKNIALTGDQVRVQTEKTLEVIRKRDALFRGARPFPHIEDKSVIIIDDGLASGYTMLAGIRFVRPMNPAKIVAAVPTGSKRTVDFILPEVEELVCLNVRSALHFAVAEAYREWHDLTDEEVLTMLRKTGLK